ncbi:MAG: LamG domain-containing protein, partial [Candidatus Aenigmarchaeota archaeon]|nr:LamG domain-containing protein [Candidatus Aenigmarchaeota archaeon]
MFNFDLKKTATIFVAIVAITILLNIFLDNSNSNNADIKHPTTLKDNSNNHAEFDSININPVDTEIIQNKELEEKIEKQTNRIIQDYIWVETNDDALKNTGGKIVLSSIGRKTFKCDGTIDNPDCFEIPSCDISEKPCYEFNNGKTIIYVNHFSGAFNTMTWTTDNDWNTGTHTNTTNSTNNLILSGTNTTGSYTSNTTTTTYAITRIKPIWNSTEQDANKNFTTEISADNGVNWLIAANNTNYTTGAGIGTGTNILYRINFSTNDSAVSPVLHDITLDYDTDMSPPTIDFVSPTENNDSYINTNYTYINTTVTDNTNTTAFIDWNRSLVGWWRFNNDADENDTYAKDWSTYGNNGTINNTNPGLNNCTGNCSGWTTNGKFGNALQFEGVDDYVEIPRNSDLEPTNYLTIEAWVIRAGTTSDAVVGRKTFTSNDYGYHLIINQVAWGNGLELSIGNGTGSQKVTTFALSWENRYYHVAAVYDNGNITIYRDGVKLITGYVAPP